MSKTTRAFLILSSLCVFLFGLRFVQTGEMLGFGLIWNLFLAWIPLFFALLARRAENYGFVKYILMATWLLFFPNAPYIITDLVHLQHLPAHLWWYDSAGIFIAAFTGLLLGIYSLSIGHAIFRKDLGATFAWGAILISLLLCGFGIYLGRFVRLNSWDLVFEPFNLIYQCRMAILEPLAMKTTLFFSVFLTAIYLAYYSLTKGNYELS